MKKQIFTAVVLAIIFSFTSPFGGPFSASAQTNMALIEQLKAQVTKLQTALQAITSKTQIIAIGATTASSQSIGYDLAVTQAQFSDTGFKVTFCNNSNGVTLPLSPGFLVQTTINGYPKEFFVPEARDFGCFDKIYDYQFLGAGIFNPANTYTAVVQVDPRNYFTETDEQNNYLQIKYPPDVDLVVVDAKFRADGGIYYSTCNEGSDTPFPKIEDSVTTEIKVDGVLQQVATNTPTVFNSANLAGSGCVYVSTGSGLANYNPLANHTAEVFVDSDNRVVETDESNNRLIFNNSIPTPEIYYPPKTSAFPNDGDLNYTWDGYPFFNIFDPITGFPTFYLIKGNYDRISIFDKLSDSVLLGLQDTNNVLYPLSGYLPLSTTTPRGVNFSFPWHIGIQDILSQNGQGSGAIVPDGRYLVKAISNTGSEDLSDVYLKIIDDPSKRYNVKLNSPNGGEVWYAGSTQQINWSEYNLTNPDLAGKYKINLMVMRDAEVNGVEVPLFLELNSGALGQNWTIPANFPPGLYKIWVSCTIADELGEKSLCSYINDTTKSKDESDGWFEIVAPDITVTSPKSGDIWPIGENRQISWTSVGFLGNEPIKVDLIGTRYGLAQGQPMSDGTVMIVMPNDILPGNYRIKISSFLNQAEIIGYSGYFTVASSSPPLTVFTPNGGETLKIGEPFDVRWSTNGMSATTSVQLFFQSVPANASTTPSGGVAIQLNNSNLGTYSYTFTPESFSSPSGAVLHTGLNKLTVSATVNGQLISDTSDAPFTITLGADQCLNITGVQTVIPVGYIRSGYVDCVVPRAGGGTPSTGGTGTTPIKNLNNGVESDQMDVIESSSIDDSRQLANTLISLKSLLQTLQQILAR